MSEDINPHNCGTCNNETCQWYSQRDQLSRINTMINREYVDHFSMRVATEMAGPVPLVHGQRCSAAFWGWEVMLGIMTPSGFERWYNLTDWIHTPGSDTDLMERSAYFAQIHYPKCREFIGGIE